MERFEYIEIQYRYNDRDCYKIIGRRCHGLDKITSDNGIFKLTDVFPGIKFNLESPTNKIKIRFQRNWDDYRFKEYSVEYNTNNKSLEKITAFNFQF